MKKILTLSVACIAIFIFLGLMPVHGEAEIYDNVIRLHVLANSDSDEDQKLKLEVRDVILKEVSEMCIDVSDIDEAEKMIRKNKSSKGGCLFLVFGTLGVIAGLLSATICTVTSGMHGGFVLYNSGFTAGLAALILVPLFDFYKIQPIREDDI